MNARAYTVLTIIALAMVPGCATPSTDKTQPNIVLIVIDTLRADALGCYGGRPGVSDELDALAEQGYLFLNVTTPSSWTRPSMGSMLTGQYPRTLGLYRERAEALPDDAVTIAEHLKAQGYRTLGYTANPNINSTYGFDVGFDKYFDSLALFDWMPGGEKPPEGAGAGLHSAVELFDLAKRDIAESPDVPTYVQVSMMEVHEWHILERGLIRDDARMQFQDGNWFSAYDQSVWQSSRDVDAFLTQLKATPGWEDAWVIITSDHGEGLNAHPDVEQSDFHGRTLYTTQTEVPLIITRLDGSLAPQRIQQRVRVIDTAPTIVELAGAPSLEDVEGKSLLPLLRGEAINLPEFFITETAFRGHDKSAVISEDWRFYINRDSHEGLAPIELQAAGRPENGVKTNSADYRPEIAEAMRAQFDAWDSTHPRRPPTPIEGEVAPEELDQLQSLGYLN